tara:strand:- start:174 stop:350 length:177 start_codon:yes stop_codon:yes gene_type:complete
MIVCPECEGEGEIDYTCGSCAGSGEGMWPGTTCTICKGSGGGVEVCDTCGGDGEVDDD